MAGIMSTALVSQWWYWEREYGGVGGGAGMLAPPHEVYSYVDCKKNFLSCLGPKLGMNFALLCKILRVSFFNQNCRIFRMCLKIGKNFILHQV